MLEKSYIGIGKSTWILLVEERMIRYLMYCTNMCCFLCLQEAKEILCDLEKRSNYDKWKNSGISISYKQWIGMKDHVQQVSFQ